nr:ATP-binding protein [Microbacterium sp. K35]
MPPAKPSGQRQDTRHAAKYVQKLATNPCPCGNFGVRNAECTCPPSAVRRYAARISGPLRDRVDIDLGLTRVAASKAISDARARVTTAFARERVQAARERAAHRWRGTPWQKNAEVPGPVLRRAPFHVEKTERMILDRALERGALTLRGYDRVLRVAWMMADLAGRERPGEEEIGRALHLRRGVAA